MEDSAEINHSRYFSLLESSSRTIRVRYELTPQKEYPKQVRAVLAAPTHSYRVVIHDYAYYENGQAHPQLIEKGDEADVWGGEAIRKAIVRTSDYWWHDLPLVLVKLDLRLISKPSRTPKPMVLSRLEFSLQLDSKPALPAQPYFIERAGRPSGGFDVLLPTVVLNPQSVPEFRQRPRIPLSPDLFYPAALGRDGSTGQAIRLSVGQEGWHEVDFARLAAAGAGIEKWDPSRVNLWMEGQKIPLEIQGLTPGGVWTPKSRLGFWARVDPAQGPRERICFLSEGTAPPARLSATNEGEILPAPAVLQSVPFRLRRAEKRVIEDGKNAAFKGKWFWQSLTPDQREGSIEIGDLGIDPRSETVTLQMSFYCDLRGSASLAVLVDGTHEIDRFKLERRLSNQLEQFPVPSEWLFGDGHTLTIRMESLTKENIQDVIYLKELTWEYQRVARPEVQSLIVERSGLPDLFDLEVEAAGAIRVLGRNEKGSQIWDLSHRLIPAASGQVLRLAQLPPACTHLELLSEGVAFEPSRVEGVQSAFLHEATEPVDLLYICHEDLREAIQPLVDYRREEGWRVRAVRAQDIYDEFGAGAYSGQAIRDFLIYTQTRWPSPIAQFVVLVGDSTYDPENYLEQPKRAVLPFGNYDARSPIANPADEWFVRINGKDALSDLIIGRLGVGDATDARSVVKKILNFEQHPLQGPWRVRALMLSDNHFESRCERIVQDTVPPPFLGQHLQVRNYAMSTNQTFKRRGTNEKAAIQAKRELISLLNRGAASMEYFGHGGGIVMAHEGWFVATARADSDALKLDNRRRLPFVTILSCLTGIIHYPRAPLYYSLSEEITRQPDRGAIAVYGPSGYGGAHDHEMMTRNINRCLYHLPIERVGDLVTLTEGFYYLQKGTTHMPEQFNLFGDPLTRGLLPPVQGRLQCTPETVNARTGGRVRLTGEGVGFEHGQGLLMISAAESQRLLRTQPVRVMEGRFSTELVWPPDAPSGRMRVVGYFWDKDSGRDAAASSEFFSAEPVVRVSPAAIAWDSSTGEIVLSATLENASALLLPAVEARLAETGRMVAAGVQPLEPNTASRVELRFVPPSGRDDAWLLHLEARWQPEAGWLFESEEGAPSVPLAIVCDQAGSVSEVRERNLLVLDLSGQPESVDSEDGSANLPLRIACSDGKSLTHLGLRLHSLESSSQQVDLSSLQAGEWWKAELGVKVEKEETRPLQLAVEHRWSNGPVQTSTCALESPRWIPRDLSLARVSVSEQTPVAGHSVHFLAEIQNHGERIASPGKMEIRTNLPRSLADALANPFNFAQPELPEVLERGEIVRRLYRWDAYDNQGELRITCRLKSSADCVPENNQIDLMLPVEEYYTYSEQLGRLRWNPAGRTRDGVQRAFGVAGRGFESRLAFEFYDAEAVNDETLHRLVYYTLAAGRFDLAGPMIDKLLVRSPMDPGTRYLEATMRFRQGRQEEGRKALQAVFRSGFFDRHSKLRYDLIHDPRFLRAQGQYKGRGWRKTEDFLFMILEEQPAHVPALLELGEFYQWAGWHELAIEVYQQIARLTGFDYSLLPVRWFEDIGRAYAQWGKPRLAMEIFDLGQSFHPEADFELWRSEPRIDLGQSPAVLKQLRARDWENLEKEQRAFLWHQVGRCYQVMGRTSAASDAFRRVLRIDSLHRSARRQLLRLRTGG